MHVSKNKIKINAKELSARVGSFFVSKRQWFLVLLALILLGFCSYLWYVYIANPKWSDSQKQEYISTQQNEAVFDQGKFNSALNEIQSRKDEYNNQIGNAPDIFRLK